MLRWLAVHRRGHKRNNLKNTRWQAQEFFSSTWNSNGKVELQYIRLTGRYFNWEIVVYNVSDKGIFGLCGQFTPEEEQWEERTERACPSGRTSSDGTDMRQRLTEWGTKSQTGDSGWWKAWYEHIPKISWGWVRITTNSGCYRMGSTQSLLSITYRRKSSFRWNGNQLSVLHTIHN